MGSLRRLLGRPSRRGLVALVAALAAAAGLTAWQLQGDAAATVSTSFATAVRGSLVVSVGGVGRIVPESAAAQLPVAGSAGAAPGSAGQAAASAAVLGGVFPRASGRLVEFFVQQGQHVRAGQPLALLDDGGAAAATVRLAETDVAAALLELQQKRTSDPLRGVPATPQELAAGRLAVAVAKARLARLLGPPRRADVQTARAELERAIADLSVLRGGTPAERLDTIRVARQGVAVAEKRLEKLLAPPSLADVAAATADVKRAEAELAALERPSLSPSPESLVAAQKSVAEARQYLATVMRSGDQEAIRDAQSSLDSALADLAVLLRPGPASLPIQLDAARAAIEAAQLRLEQLAHPANAADVEAARLELERARAELRRLEAGPGPAARAAAQQAVAAARARLAQLLAPPLHADVVAARLEVRRAEAELAVLRARGGPASPGEIALARLKVEAARARLESARVAAGLLTVRAPVAGVVTELLAARGAPVDGLTPVAVVLDLDRLAVNLSLSEFDAAQVKRGLEAVVRVDALGGRSYSGRVLTPALAGSDAGGVVTFPVRVSLLRAARGLKPGMNVSVRIVVAERRNVVRIPLDAVARDDEGRPVVSVLVGEEETVERHVRLGLANNKDVEVVKGLRAGERVLLPEPDTGGEE